MNVNGRCSICKFKLKLLLLKRGRGCKIDLRTHSFRVAKWDFSSHATSNAVQYVAYVHSDIDLNTDVLTYKYSNSLRMHTLSCTVVWSIHLRSFDRINLGHSCTRKQTAQSERPLQCKDTHNVWDCVAYLVVRHPPPTLFPTGQPFNPTRLRMAGGRQMLNRPSISDQ